MKQVRLTQDAKRFYSVRDLIEVAGISRALAYAWVQQEDFPKIKAGKRVLIPVDLFDAWVKEQVRR